MMAPFHYVAGHLHAEDVDLAAIVAAVGTPAYVYSANAMRHRLGLLQTAFAGSDVAIFYAIKANSNLAVIRTLHEAGAGAEIVSQGELERALAAGVPGERIIMAGVAKSADEIKSALDAGICQFNVESWPELQAIDAIARSMNRRAPIALRVNPDVAADTHDKISTGRKHDKFGIAYDEAPAIYRQASDMAGIELVGLHIHIGSQITAHGPFEQAYARAADMVRSLASEGIRLKHLDFGGGFGIPYEKSTPRLDLDGFASTVRNITDGLGCRLFFEPGRFLVGEAGMLLAQVIYVKHSGDRRFLILDTGMSELMRPALYDAHHDIVPLRAPTNAQAPLAYDVVGPICESTDVLARSRSLPHMAAGDVIGFADAGAYGAVMVSCYNSRPTPAEVIVDGARFAIVRPRREPASHFADERLPEW